MAVLLSPVGGVAAQFFDNDGNVLSGGKIYTYSAGTTTPQATYTTSLGNIAHANPIILDSAGRVPTGEIWLTDGAIYKFVLKDANDTLIATYDNIVGINSNFVNYTAQQEIQTATAGQTVFTFTTMSYQTGTNSLSVYVDGVNQYGPGAQYAYTETSSTSVTFNSGLHVGAEVKFTTTTQTTGNATSADVVAYDPPFTGSVPTNVEAKLAQTVSVKDFGAVGDGVVDDTAAIQAAINATVGGGMLLIPIGRYLVSSTLVFSSVITVTGQGVGSVIVAASTMNSSTDLLLIEPASPSSLLAEFWTFSDFSIECESGPSAGYAMHISAANANIAGLLIDRIRFAKTGNTSIYADGANTASLMTIQNCFIANGISIPTAGDTIRILNNSISGDNFCLDISFIPGALLLLLMGNNSTAKYGVHIGSPALFSVIQNNEFETFSSFVGSNGAFLDIDGSPSDNVYDFVISQNSFSIVNGIVAHAIRVNHATRTSITDNRFFSGITGISGAENVLITSNADRTYIGTNAWDNNTPFSQRVIDNGTSTVIATAFQGDYMIPKANVRIGTVNGGNEQLIVQASGAYAAILAQSGGITSGSTIVDFRNGANASGFLLTADNKIKIAGYATGGANKTLQVDSNGNIVAV